MWAPASASRSHSCRARSRANISLQIPGSPGGGSDYASFIYAGVPAFCLSSLSWDSGSYTWHKNRDTFDKIVTDDLKNQRDTRGDAYALGVGGARPTSAGTCQPSGGPQRAAQSVARLSRWGAQLELTSDEADRVEKRAIGEELCLYAAYGLLILPIS